MSLPWWLIQTDGEEDILEGLSLELSHVAELYADFVKIHRANPDSLTAEQESRYQELPKIIHEELKQLKKLLIEVVKDEACLS